MSLHLLHVLGAVQGTSLYRLRHTNLYVWNIVVGVILLSALSAFLATFFYRVCVVTKQKKTW